MKEKMKHKIKHRADQIASHYGFDLIEIKGTKYFGHKKNVAEKEKIKILQYYGKKTDLKKDLPTRMFFHNRRILKEEIREGDRLGLDIIGVDCGIAEATVIKTAFDILKEEKYKDLFVEINSIGDKKSVATFEKELKNFYRKNKENLDASDKKKISSGKVLEVFASDKDYLMELHEEAPKPIHFLSDTSSLHFKEVLEYLEGLNIPYVIPDTLIGQTNYFSKIIFQIKGKKDKKMEILARGGRYDDLAWNVVRKRNIAAVGLQMNFSKKEKKKAGKATEDVSIFMIQLGFQAQLKGLEVAEILKNVNIPFLQNIRETKMSKQLQEAIDKNTNHSIIIGQKEANENKVLVRNMKRGMQDEVYMKDLAKYIEKITK